ncbi:MAG: class I SAM-dependent methyltransferase [Myxococcota bacterium]
MTLSGRRDRLATFYAPLAASPSPARRVGWESEPAHALRLALLVAALEPLDHIGSVVDVGCGDGALIRLLRAKGYSGSYRGEDLLDAMVDAARARSPDESFEAHDLMTPGPPADAVTLSGALNTWQADDQDRAARDALRTLWERARVALVVDFAVRDRHPGGPGIFPLDLPALYQHARDLGAVVSVREDVLPGEALLVLRRDRRPTLESHLPAAHQAPARAALLLAAREPAAARDTLSGLTGPEVDLQRALAQVALGRVRDAESTLRRLAAAQHTGAQFHLAALALATGRAPEGVAALTALAESPDPLADDARLLLARHFQHTSQPEIARRWAAQIVDPLLAREGAAIARSA